MAMRPRGGDGAGASAGKRRHGVVRPVYEDFKPMSEWKQDDDGSHILNVHLPGFMKEQIKVSTRDPNTIIVQGERLVGGNKWSHFHEEFLAPGEINSLQVKYEGGILSIKVQVEKPPGINIQEQLAPQDPRDQSQVSNEGGLHTKEMEMDVNRNEDWELRTTSEYSEKKHQNGNMGHGETEMDVNRNEDRELRTTSENSKKKHDQNGNMGNGELYGAMIKERHTMSKGFGELDEERQRLMNNIRVAMIVIVATIAYVTYKFT